MNSAENDPDSGHLSFPEVHPGEAPVRQSAPTIEAQIAHSALLLKSPDFRKHVEERRRRKIEEAVPFRLD